MTRRHLPERVLLFAVVVMAACDAPVTPLPVDPGATVPAYVCVGRVGCPCGADGCSTGECIDGTCVECRRGEADCVCRANGTCSAGLRCSAASLCEACPPGDEGCACQDGDGCAEGLLCDTGRCVTDRCVDGAASCRCRQTSPECDGDAYCDEDNLCRVCTSDVVGCPCNEVERCFGQTVCDAVELLCREPLSCAALLTGGLCGANQACIAENGLDAVCIAETCDPEFKWTGTACKACVTAGCLNEPSCMNVNGGLGSQCVLENRSCVEAAGDAACGACLRGFVEALDGTCREAPLCGDVTCASDEYCEASGAAPVCAKVPCPGGQALNSTRKCQSCSLSCSGDGLTGRLWPRTTLGDECACETSDGFFSSGIGFVRACDADGDGWVNELADDKQIRADPALKANARCRIRTVNRVRLFDEYGVSIDVLSCTDGLKQASQRLAASEGGGQVGGGLALYTDGTLVDPTQCTFSPMRLLETQRNDTPGIHVDAPRPAYGGADGRGLAGNELNPLTKACVSSTGDFNDNLVEDIAEVQGALAVSRPAPDADRQRLESFSYFVELASSWAVGDVLVIAERSRCGVSFPLRYDTAIAVGATNPADNYSTTTDSPYWRTCSRNRDPSYNASNRVSGFDFAQYGCSDARGTCALVGPAHPTLTQRLADPSRVSFRDFGLCRLNGSKPADRRWRGMNHHSQFKCVNLVPGLAVNNHDLTVTGAGTGVNQMTFNKCRARLCATSDGSDCSGAQGSGLQTRQPIIDCAAQSGGVAGSVDFAAVNYRPYGPSGQGYSPSEGSSYRGGCVNEDDTWAAFLCPYPQYSLDKSLSNANFGRYSCYKFLPNFLWGDAGNQGAISTLRWGADTTNGSVLSPRPAP
jgi:hypothetical protein